MSCSLLSRSGRTPIRFSVRIPLEVIGLATPVTLGDAQHMARVTVCSRRCRHAAVIPKNVLSCLCCFVSLSVVVQGHKDKSAPVVEVVSEEANQTKKERRRKSKELKEGAAPCAPTAATIGAQQTKSGGSAAAAAAVTVSSPSGAAQSPKMLVAAHLDVSLCSCSPFFTAGNLLSPTSG